MVCLNAQVIMNNRMLSSFDGQNLAASPFSDKSPPPGSSVRLHPPLSNPAPCPRMQQAIPAHLLHAPWATYIYTTRPGFFSNIKEVIKTCAFQIRDALCAALSSDEHLEAPSLAIICIYKCIYVFPLKLVTTEVRYCSIAVVYAITATTLI